MGYYASLVDMDFFIRKSDFPNVMKVFKGFIEKIDKGHYYSFVSKSSIENVDNVEEAFTVWGYHIDFNENGDIYDIYMENSKWGDEEKFFSAIAPYVKDGSYLMYSGESGDPPWRFTFEGGKLKEESGIIEYTDYKSIVNDILKVEEVIPMILGINNDLDEIIAKKLREEEENEDS